MVGFSDVSHCDDCGSCEDDCLVAEDNFDREGSTGVGDAWTEDAGDWEIRSSKLYTESQNARILYDLDHPDGSSSHGVTATLRGDGASGDKPHIILAYENSTKYLRVQLEFTDTMLGGCGLMRFIEDGATIHSIPVRGLGTATTFSFKAEYHSETGVLWGVLPDLGISACVYATGIGTKVGFGTGSGTGQEVSIDDFEWYRIEEEDYPSGTGSGTGTLGTLNQGCPKFFDCDIHIMNQGNSNFTDCAKIITGDPWNPVNTSPWEVQSLVEASDVDEANSFGAKVRAVVNTTTILNIELGNYTASFFVSGGNWRASITGPGVSVNEILSPSTGGGTFTFIFSFVNGVLCAGFENEFTVKAIPTGSSIGRTLFVSANEGNAQEIEFTRCPECPSDCGCGDSIAPGFILTISGVSGTCSNPHLWNTSWVSGPNFGEAPNAGGAYSMEVLECSWYHEPSAMPTGSRWVDVHVAKSIAGPPFTYFLDVALYTKSGGEQARYRYSVVTSDPTFAFDCAALSNLVIPFLRRSSTTCTFDTATCVLSSL